MTKNGGAEYVSEKGGDKTDREILDKVSTLTAEEFFSLRGLLAKSDNQNLKQFGKWMQHKRRE